MKKNKKTKTEIKDYDTHDTSESIDLKKPLTFEDIGLQLPALPPTQVISMRIPSQLLNEIKAYGSQRDIPYQALIKLMLSESIERYKKKKAA